MEAILFQHLSPRVIAEEKGTTSPPNPDGVFTEVIFGPLSVKELTQPIKADNSICHEWTVRAERERDKILSQSDRVRWCQMPLRTLCPPHPTPPFSFIFQRGHQITSQHWSTPSRLCILSKKRELVESDRADISLACFKVRRVGNTRDVALTARNGKVGRRIRVGGRCGLGLKCRRGCQKISSLSFTVHLCPPKLSSCSARPPRGSGVSSKLSAASHESHFSNGRQNWQHPPSTVIKDHDRIYTIISLPHSNSLP